MPRNRLEIGVPTFVSYRAGRCLTRLEVRLESLPFDTFAKVEVSRESPGSLTGVSRESPGDSPGSLPETLPGVSRESPGDSPGETPGDSQETFLGTLPETTTTTTTTTTITTTTTTTTTSTTTTTTTTTISLVSQTRL